MHEESVDVIDARQVSRVSEAAKVVVFVKYCRGIPSSLAATEHRSAPIRRSFIDLRVWER